MQYDEDALQAVRESRLLINQYDAWLVDEFEPFIGQRVIEIGCGLGNMLQHFVDRDLVIGIETSNDTVVDAKKRMAQYGNVAVCEQSITNPSVLDLMEYRFDSAISVNVFEHIEDDELAMRNTGKLVESGGYFVLIVPAHQWLYGTMDKSIGHYRRYTKLAARQKLEKAGFRVVRQKYVNLLGAVGWFVNGRLLRKRVPPDGQLRLLNTLVPTIRAVERMVSPPFGISLMTIAQRVSDASLLT